MKKIVRVIVEKEIEVDIPDAMLTPACLADFSRFTFSVEAPEDLLVYAAKQYAERGYGHLEGMGWMNHPRLCNANQMEIGCHERSVVISHEMGGE